MNNPKKTLTQAVEQLSHEQIVALFKKHFHDVTVTELRQIFTGLHFELITSAPGLNLSYEFWQYYHFLLLLEELENSAAPHAQFCNGTDR